MESIDSYAHYEEYAKAKAEDERAVKDMDAALTEMDRGGESGEQCVTR